MNYYALLYDLAPDYLTRRSLWRDDHLRLAREANTRSELLFAGAFSEPVDRALLIFHVTDVSAVEHFVREDPYVLNKLVTRWEIRPWTVVVGG